MLKKPCILGVLLLRVTQGAVWTFQDRPHNGSVVAESTSVSGKLDGPKVLPGVNSTSYDWWYFDAVSASTNASVVFSFYNSGPDGFVNQYEGGPLDVTLQGSFPNGTLFSLASAANEGATVELSEDGVAGKWKGSGFSFRGTSLERPDVTYVVTVNAPSIGVEGTLTLISRAPAHYPCGMNVPGVSEVMLPHVWWANAVPDASASVTLTIDGSPLVFSDGVGYHDKNWGDAPFASVTSSWYWGHAQVGPYSLVWFDAISSNGTDHSAGYVAKDGEVLQSSCAAGASVVRPWGVNDTYPPTYSTGAPQGLELQFDLGDGKNFVANVTTGLTTKELGIYFRNIGMVTAVEESSRGCGESYEGRALYEEFKLLGAPAS